MAIILQLNTYPVVFCFIMVLVCLFSYWCFDSCSVCSLFTWPCCLYLYVIIRFISTCWEKCQTTAIVDCLNRVLCYCVPYHVLVSWSVFDRKRNYSGDTLPASTVTCTNQKTSASNVHGKQVDRALTCGPDYVARRNLGVQLASPNSVDENIGCRLVEIFDVSHSAMFLCSLLISFFCRFSSTENSGVHSYNQSD